MSRHRLFVAYLGLLLVAVAAGALAGKAAAPHAADPLMENRR